MKKIVCRFRGLSEDNQSEENQKQSPINLRDRTKVKKLLKFKEQLPFFRIYWSKNKQERGNIKFQIIRNKKLGSNKLIYCRKIKLKN